MDARQPALVMIQGPEPGSIYKLPDNRVTTIGRSSRNSIRIVSPTVSRFHCEIAWVNGQWQLADLNSKKGTMVNGKRITSRTIIRPGDIIRLSTTVFRFDMIDEAAQKDGAMLAIREAELDQRVQPKGEAIASLDDIAVRSRLDGQAQACDRRHERASPLRVRLAFLGGVGLAVVLATVGTLLYAHGKLRSPASPGQPIYAARAESALREAEQALKVGLLQEGLRKLALVARNFKGTEAAEKATQILNDTIWSLVQDKLSEVTRAEGDGNYEAALRAYAELERLAADAAVRELVAGRREYTVRLAHAAYRALDAQARQRLQEGDRQGAIALYERARLGLPELQRQVEAKLAELKAGAR